MSDAVLFAVITSVTVVVVGVAVTGFIIFNRFIQREKDRGEVHRQIHETPKDS
jgi:hypothetical protein